MWMKFSSADVPGYCCKRQKCCISYKFIVYSCTVHEASKLEKECLYKLQGKIIILHLGVSISKKKWASVRSPLAKSTASGGGPGFRKIAKRSRLINEFLTTASPLHICLVSEFSSGIIRSRTGNRRQEFDGCDGTEMHYHNNRNMQPISNAISLKRILSLVNIN